jgi:hypothetical protein
LLGPGRRPVDTSRLLKENQALLRVQMEHSSGGSGAGRHAAKLGRAPSQSVPPVSRQPCDDRTGLPHEK